MYFEDAMGELSFTIGFVEGEIVFWELEHVLYGPFQSFAVCCESAFVHEEITL